MVTMRVFLKFYHPKKNLTHSGNRRIEAKTLGECNFIVDDIIKEFFEGGWKLKKRTLINVSYNDKPYPLEKRDQEE